MALLSRQAFKDKWASVTGRFRDNTSFEIAEDDYREFSQDIVDSALEPIDKLGKRLAALETPLPVPRQGIKWLISPTVNIAGSDVAVTASEAEFDGVVVSYAAGIVKTVPLPPAGLQRIDVLAATAAGWEYIYGDADVDPLAPALDPAGNLLFAAHLKWTGQAGAVIKTVQYARTVNGIAPDTTGNVKLDASHLRQTSNFWSYLGLAASATLISVKDWLEQLTGKVKANEVELADHEQKLYEHTLQLNDHEDRIATNTAKNAAQDDVLDAHDQRIFGIERELDDLQTKHTLQQEEIDAIEAQLPHLGKVNSVNNQLPDANKNITLGAEHIDAEVNDSTWWGTLKIKVKGGLDRLANEIKLLQANKADKSAVDTKNTEQDGRLTNLENGKLDKASVVGTTGSSETLLMHQRAVTDQLNALLAELATKALCRLP